MLLGGTQTRVMATEWEKALEQHRQQSQLLAAEIAETETLGICILSTPFKQI